MFARRPKTTIFLAATAITAGTLVVRRKYHSGTKFNNFQSDFNPYLISPVEDVEINLPSRSQLWNQLTTKDHQFDLLIIGGGATGTGCALDAATRGLNVALVERDDFASGTSSKSTKMAHGGVRYLEKAFLQFSKSQLDLVIEALNERAHLLNTAPHLCKILPILIPVYNYWQLPYFYAGCKFYDFFAGDQNLKSSYLISRKNAIEIAPMLDAANLKAALVYHDGSFNDSRLNSSIAITAIENGATVLNYVEVRKLLKDPNSNKIIGVTVQDKETGEISNVKSKVIVNATGPYSDTILQMDKNLSGLPDLANIDPKMYDPNDISSKIAVSNPKMVVPSSGVHIILPSYYCPKQMGLLDARTTDGRVMFFLPWQGKVIAGTTDIPMSQVPDTPVAKETDIQDILKELQHYIKFPVRREDVLSAWAGIRPLVRDPRLIMDDATQKLGTTQGLVRSHFLFTSDNGLITIAGGKWTTYREMAEETIDEVVKYGHFANFAKPCKTKDLKLIGAENWDPNLVALLSQKFNLSSMMAKYLSENYGTRSTIICQLFEREEMNKLPVQLAGIEDKPILGNVDFNTFRYPITIAELKYAMKYEYARTPLDFLMRRTRFAYLDAYQALLAVKGTVKVMGDEFGWDSKRREQEIKNATLFIESFGV
ncbi:glycerol-3-phosphate dehydrogenase NDAI_0F00210 [Naumovozyma dairenensis CBS 421]|uniref:Glycerol-3-phosphate dehydrogenase n=1 Tax=Naumovozyma dairenensis (strain ATCC 10597 / BCRC 20456 / CBS 421 / NBRC 0211 / NRRL Y-12639) TaxID=1071378 RepID=G0WC29_NAUDC|nr:hypothetical protein NDAI_0F00210 [Naumovozyma dairenensis CBS 421]CCD25340.1 hypothetical protein NDAI_0F00210 [Naumovozyma dairenensis CBS 421]